MWWHHEWPKIYFSLSVLSTVFSLLLIILIHVFPVCPSSSIRMWIKGMETLNTFYQGKVQALFLSLMTKQATFMLQRLWTEKNRPNTPWPPRLWPEIPTSHWSLHLSSLSRCRTSTTIPQNSSTGRIMLTWQRCPTLVSLNLRKGTFVNFFSFSMSPSLTACSSCIIQNSWNLTLRKWLKLLLQLLFCSQTADLSRCVCVFTFVCVYCFFTEQYIISNAVLSWGNDLLPQYPLFTAHVIPVGYRKGWFWPGQF